jgi:AraC-like DNA-binding protein
MSKYHFVREFEKIVGFPPIEYRNNIRLQHAADLLSEERLTVSQISSLVGYSSPSYFSSAFKQKYRLSPKQYRNKK